MKKLFVIMLAMGLCVCASQSVFAAANDTQTVTYEVTAINELNLDGATVELTVNSAVAGSQPTQATDTDTYDITTNCGTNAKKITGAISETNMPSGLTFKVTMTAPTGGVSSGATTMSTTAADLVTGVDAVAESNIAIDYSLDATVAAGVVASANKTLIVTIADVE